MQLDYFRVVAVRSEADVLTVWLLRVDESAALRKLARLSLVQLAQREQRPRKLRLRHRVQHIALILRRVERLFQQIFLAAALDAGIVSGRYMAAPEDVRAVKELCKLHAAVAVDAGVRGHAHAVLRGKAVDDFFPKIVRKIKDVVRHAEPVRHAARVLDIVERAAGVPLGYARVLV